MDRSSIIYLVKETYSQDNLGIFQPTEVSKKVYCHVDSVTQSEWFEGGRNGLNPEYRFTMFRYDYDNEKIVVYNNVRYTVYRTYITTNDAIELYCERREGNG